MPTSDKNKITQGTLKTPKQQQETLRSSGGFEKDKENQHNAVGYIFY